MLDTQAYYDSFVGMNRLPFEKRRQILHLMVEGDSVRGIARLVDVSPVTVLRHLGIAGRACAAFHDVAVVDVNAKQVQCDEIWSFVFAKDKNAKQEMKLAGKAGSIWTWTAIDRDSKLIVSYLVGNRDAENAHEFMHDLAHRLSDRVQLTTDGLSVYLEAVNQAFDFDKVDYAQLVKIYGESGEKGPERKYSPGVCIGAKKRELIGFPQRGKITTSHVEKHNQTMRQHMKRFTRLTAAHSKKAINHLHMVALYTTWYDWVRINSSVRMTPAMAAGLTDKLWDMGDLTRLVEDWELREAEHEYVVTKSA
jgi:IS1 family transposase